MKNIYRTFLPLLFWLLLCQLPALPGGYIVRQNLVWYHGLAKPPFVPPDVVFGVVWSILYLFLGISAFLLFRKGLQNHKKTAVLFIIQLALNMWWTPIFFGLHELQPALLLLVVMLAETFWLWKEARLKNGLAALLLVPYAGWLGFACYLNFGFWLLN